MRHLGLLVLFTLASCQEPEPPPIELTTEQFSTCLDSYRQHVRSIETDVMLNPLLEEQGRLLKLWEPSSLPHLDVRIHDIMIQAQKSMLEQIRSGNSALTACQPVLEFVATGLDGLPGNLSNKPSGRR